MSSSRPRAAAFAVAAQPLARLATTDAPHQSRSGGGDRNRTDDLLLAKQALSQLSYTPSVLSEAQNRVAAPAALAPRKPQPALGHQRLILLCAALVVALATTVAARHFAAQKSVVGQGGFEPPTSRLSSARSNQLSY
jgi:hypothetical protein